VATTTQVVITGDSSGLVNAVNAAVMALGKINTSAATATKSLDSINTSSSNIQKSLGAIKLDSIINLGQRAVGAAQSITQLADQATTLMNRMKSLTANSADAANAFQRMINISNNTGLAVEDVGQTFQKITLATRSMGYTMEQAAQATDTMAKALAITGTTGPAAASAMYQIVQSLGRGVVAYEDFKQLQEVAGPVLELLANRFGMTGAQFLAAIQNFKIGARDIMSAFADMRGSVDQEFSQLTPTVGRALNAVKNNFMVLLNTMEEKYGIFSKVAEAILKMSDNLGTIIPIIGAMGAAWAGAKIASWGVMLFEAAAGATALAAAMARVGVGMVTGEVAAGAGAAATVGTLSKNLLKLGGRLVPLAAGAYVAYEAYDALTNFFTEKKGGGKGGNLEGATTKPAMMGNLTPVGKDITEAVLKTEYETFAKTYSVNQALVGLNERRVEQEAAVLKFAADNHYEYKNLVAQAGDFVDKLRQTVALEQERKKIAEIRKATPTGINEEAAFGISSAQTAANAALRANDLVLAQQYNDQILLMEMNRADQIIQLQNKVFENQQLKRIQETTGSMFGYDTQKAMAQDAANFEKKSATEKTAFVISEAATALTTMGQQNKSAFEAAKALNIANALMNTYMGFTKTLATYPFPINIGLAALTLGAGMAQVAAIRAQTYSGRALGGPVQGGTPYMVGERGPELFTPGSSGNITRNDQLGGGSGATINFNIQANDAQGFDDLLIKRRGMIQQFVRDAMTENGQRSKM
jgi:tape measure domain-containing protein